MRNAWRVMRGAPRITRHASRRRFVIRIVSRRRTIIVSRHRSHVRRRLEIRRSAPATRRAAATVAAGEAAAVGSALASLAWSTAIAPAALVDARATSQNLFAARGEHSLQRFDAVVGRLEKEIFHHRLGTLELRDQHLRVGTTRHLAAHLRHHAVATRAMQYHEDAPLSRLHEVWGLRDRMLRHPRWSTAHAPAFPFRHGFGRLPERRSKEYTPRRVSRRPAARKSTNCRPLAPIQLSASNVPSARHAGAPARHLVDEPARPRARVAQGRAALESELRRSFAPNAVFVFASKMMVCASP